MTLGDTWQGKKYPKVGILYKAILWRKNNDSSRSEQAV
jgi:hypothetical protein